MQLVQAIQRAYNLDSPPVVKIERGVVTVSEATTLVCSSSIHHFLEYFYFCGTEITFCVACLQHKHRACKYRVRKNKTFSLDFQMYTASYRMCIS